MSSLSGQNSNGRISGTRSSRVSSTSFHQLRELDKKISKIDENITFWLRAFHYKEADKLKKRRENLDKKRQEVRNKRKKYEA